MPETSLDSEDPSRRECPICFCILLPPVYQCHNGHLLCKRCISRLDKCPVCRKPLLQTDRIRNLAIEEVISEQIFPCEYSKHGCNVKLRGDAIGKHIDRCVHAPTKLCKLAGIECNQDVAVGHFLDHFLRHHHRLGSPTEPLIQGFPLGAGYLDLTRVPMQTKPKYFIIDDHDQIFCLILHTKLRNGLITWRCFAVFYDGFESLPAPEVEITLFIDNEKSVSVPLTWKGHASKFSTDLNDLQPCFTLPVKHLKSIPQWRVSVQLSKPLTCKSLSTQQRRNLSTQVTSCGRIQNSVHRPGWEQFMD